MDFCEDCGNPACAGGCCDSPCGCCGALHCDCYQLWYEADRLEERALEALTPAAASALRFYRY